MHESLIETGVTTGMIFVISFGAVIFANFVNLAGFTGGISDWLIGLEISPMGIVIAICLIYLVMGCIFDSLSMLILTIPIFAAILKPMGVDMVWFGIIAVITVEMGLITPARRPERLCGQGHHRRHFPCHRLQGRLALCRRHGPVSCAGLGLPADRHRYLPSLMSR